MKFRWRSSAIFLGLLGSLLTLHYAHAVWANRANVDARYPYVNSTMTDFRDTVVLPAQALARGLNPYDIPAYRQVFPYAQEFDPYAPWWLTLTGPLARLEWGHAVLVWSCLLAVGTSFCAFWAGIQVRRHLGDLMPGALWSRTSLVAWGALFVCFQWLWRPTTVGQGLGNVGALAGLVALVAIIGREDRWHSVFLALAWVKPQFALPVIVILLARGHWRRVVGGTALAGLASLPMIVQLSMRTGGLSGLISSVLGSTKHLSDRTDREPLEGRVDLAALFDLAGWHPDAKVTMALGGSLLVLAAVTARRSGLIRPGATTLLLALGLLVGFPHIHYDLALLGPVVLWCSVECWLMARGRLASLLRDPCVWALCLLAVVGLLPGAHLMSGPQWSRTQGILTQLAYVVMLFVFARSRVRPSRETNS